MRVLWVPPPSSEPKYPQVLLVPLLTQPAYPLFLLNSQSPHLCPRAPLCPPVHRSHPQSGLHWAGHHPSSLPPRPLPQMGPTFLPLALLLCLTTWLLWHRLQTGKLDPPSDSVDGLQCGTRVTRVWESLENQSHDAPRGMGTACTPVGQEGQGEEGTGAEPGVGPGRKAVPLGQGHRGDPAEARST